MQHISERPQLHLSNLRVEDVGCATIKKYVIANTSQRILYTVIKPKAPVPKIQASTIWNKSLSELTLSIGHMTQWDSNIRTEMVYSIAGVFLVHQSHSKTKPNQRTGKAF